MSKRSKTSSKTSSKANDPPQYTNMQIIEKSLNLITRCIDCQFSNVKDKQFKDDFKSDLIIILAAYDNQRMNKMYKDNRLNSFITAVIKRNIYSNTSPYYRDYYRFQNRTNEIGDKEKDTIADE